MKNEEMIRSYFSAWEKNDWDSVKSHLAEDFSFNSPVDDFIDIDAYEKKCWPLSTYIKAITIDKVIETGDEAFARYTSQMKDGASARCVEFFEFENGKIKGIDVFWGFPWSGS